MITITGKLCRLPLLLIKVGGKGICTRFGFFRPSDHSPGLRSKKSHMFTLLHIHIASHCKSITLQVIASQSNVQVSHMA